VRLVSPGYPREGMARGEGRRRARHLPLQNEESRSSRSVPVPRRCAEVCRPPSGSEKRVTYAAPVESRSDERERANGSLTGSVPRPRKRTGAPSAKGGWFFEERQSSSRECRCSKKVTRARSGFGSCALRVAAAGGRHPGSAKRTPFTRPPRNRSWRPPDRARLSLKREARRREGGGDRDAIGGWTRTCVEEENASLRAPASHRSGSHAVKRGSPRPRLRQAAPSFLAHAARVFGRATPFAE